MKSNYRRLGEYIRQVDIRNSEGKEENLLGVSVQKKFIPSIANTVGTDFSKYKVVKRGQFTYIPDTSRRGDKIGIALLRDYDEGLVSNVYTVFEVVDEMKLVPDYLMLWFNRPEFDRYARFKSHGSVREVMDWDELCNVELPVPSYEKQMEIVDAYQTIVDRIELKQKINDNLADQAVNWINKLFETHPSELTSTNIGNLVDSGLLMAPMDGNHGEIHPKASDYVSKGVPFIMANNLVDGYVDYNNCAFITETQAKILRKGFSKPGDVLLTHKATIGRTAIIMDEYPITILTPQVTYYRTQDYLYNGFLRYYFETSQFQDTLSAWSGAGSTRAYIGITKQLELPFVLPNKQLMISIQDFISPIEQIRYSNYKEITHLKQMAGVLLSKLSSR